MAGSGRRSFEHGPERVVTTDQCVEGPANISDLHSLREIERSYQVWLNVRDGVPLGPLLCYETPLLVEGKLISSTPAANDPFINYVPRVPAKHSAPMALALARSRSLAGPRTLHIATSLPPPRERVGTGNGKRTKHRRCTKSFLPLGVCSSLITDGRERLLAPVRETECHLAGQIRIRAEPTGSFEDSESYARHRVH
jgi:hypothetical protein